MKISIVGAGPGDKSLLTLEGKRAIEEADILIGAERLVREYSAEKTVYPLYKPEEIAERIKNSGVGNRIVILRSGDPGFFSSLNGLLKVLEEDEAFKGVKTEIIPGISSMQYFLENLHLSWEKVKLVSLHGRKANIIGYIRRFPRVFTLLSSYNDLRETAEKLIFYHMDKVKILIGTRLSYPDEDVHVTDPRGIVSEIDKEDGRKRFSLAVAVFINSEASDPSFVSIKDQEFIRGDIPMTKREVRTLSISSLGLKPDSVLFDIGAGTGSISVEASQGLIDGEVYAIEKRSEAVDLILQNKRKFAADNIKVISDEAPECLRSLPMPTHIFIGGSGGKLREIFGECMSRFPKAGIVLNITSLDSLSEINGILKERELEADITLVSISRVKDIKGNKIMNGLNPVYIISIPGAGDRE